MILLGAWCGLRIADAANLTWESVNLDAGTLTFQPQKTRNHSSQPLVIAMHPELTAALTALLRGKPKAPVFPSLHGRKPGSHGGLSNEFSRLVEQAGVTVRVGSEKKGVGRRFRSKGFYSFRRTLVFRMAHADVSPEVRGAIAGHSSDALHRRYVHLNIDSQRIALSKLGALDPSD